MAGALPFLIQTGQRSSRSQSMNLSTDLCSDPTAVDRLIELLDDRDIRSFVSQVELSVDTNVFGDLAVYHKDIEAIFACPSIADLKILVSPPRDADAENLPMLRRIIHCIITTPPPSAASAGAHSAEIRSLPSFSSASWSMRSVGIARRWSESA